MSRSLISSSMPGSCPSIEDTSSLASSRRSSSFSLERISLAPSRSETILMYLSPAATIGSSSLYSRLSWMYFFMSDITSAPSAAARARESSSPISSVSERTLDPARQHPTARIRSKTTYWANTYSHPAPNVPARPTSPFSSSSTNPPPVFISMI